MHRYIINHYHRCLSCPCPFICPFRWDRISSSDWRSSSFFQKRCYSCDFKEVLWQWLAYVYYSCWFMRMKQWLNKAEGTFAYIDFQSAKVRISHLPESTHLRYLVHFKIQPSQIRSIQVDNGLNIGNPILFYDRSVYTQVQKLQLCEPDVQEVFDDYPLIVFDWII